MVLLGKKRAARGLLPRRRSCPKAGAVTNVVEMQIANEATAAASNLWARAGLIGGTGFVGGNLLAQRRFARRYSSRTIADIAGERFTTLVCAGAPATMWAANAHPDEDRANLLRLADRIATARFDRLVLISTIAVLDDAGAGHTESSARYEATKAYGRNRRELEAILVERHGAVVLRLPALFGEGLRKNFVFDLINPVPSFLKPEAFRDICGAFTGEEGAAAAALYRRDDALGMMRLDRDRLDRTSARAMLEAAFTRANAPARSFTNSASAFQFYNVAHLARDIERSLDASLPLLHICSEPIRAGELNRIVFGEPFENDAPPLVREDMRTDHARLWGSETPYLYPREQVLAELVHFVRARLP